ncbi:hypothetical protein AB7M17_000923 [Bradyrhizobium sp. USDA 377]
MPAAPEIAAPGEGDLELAADQPIEAYGGDARKMVKALLVANDFLKQQLEALRTKVSTGYARGRARPSRERKDEANG